MFDHIGINVKNLEESKQFYVKTLAPLGMKIHAEWAGIACGFGVEQPIFWIGSNEDTSKHSTGVHICFNAESRALVNDFYKAGLAAGGKDNGAPGIREHYDKDYYAAFIIDLDGNNIEAVCRKSE